MMYTFSKIGVYSSDVHHWRFNPIEWSVIW